MSLEQHEQDRDRELEEFEARTMAGLANDDDEPGVDEEADTDTEQDQEATLDEATTTDEQQASPGDKPGASEPPADKGPEGTKSERAALRAARRGERIARQDAERLRQEVAELRKSKPAEFEDDDDALLSDLEQDMPQVAARFKALKAAAAAKPATPPAPPAFVPDALPDALQAAVDEIDDLSDWQHQPDQKRWRMAKAVDAVLLNHPKWSQATEGDRLAEVARRVRSELDSAPPARATKPPARTPSEITEREPETLSSLRGGGAPRNREPTYSGMTDDEIIASLR